MTVELGVVYWSLSIGAAFITAPVGAIGTALAVTAGLVGGDPLTLTIVAGLSCTVIGGGLCAAGDSDRPEPLNLPRSIAACLLAAAGVAAMQITLHTAGKVNPYWAAELEHLTTAATAALIIAAVALRHRVSPGHGHHDSITPELSQLPLLILTALTGAGGDVAYAAASTAALSTVSAIASLYPIPTIALAFVVQHRHTHRIQALGIIIALAGATILGAVSS